MIGLFDSGHGGLTVYRELIARFPEEQFIYLGDHANAPYGNRPSDKVLELSQQHVSSLFDMGCKLVMLACNTATCVAGRSLQQDWLPFQSQYAGHNVLGIVAPTVEAATQTPWAVTTPQYPQKFNTDIIAIFGTQRTVTTNVYPEEIIKRCPQAKIVQVTCGELAGAIETGESDDALRGHVKTYVNALLEQLDGKVPDRVILGCTHFPLVEHMFVEALPVGTKVLSQPRIVADSLEDYLARHPRFSSAVPADAKAADAPADGGHVSRLFTTGNAEHISDVLASKWNVPVSFEPMRA